MLVGIQQHPSFSAQTYFNYETFLFQCFSTVFGIRPFFEMHRGMWSGHIFSRFYERFWHLVRFRNTQRHVARLYFFSFSLAFFLHLLASNRFGILPIFEMYRRHVLRSYFFSFSCTTSKKVIEVNFRSVVQLIYKKQDKKKLSFPAIEKRLDFNNKRV